MTPVMLERMPRGSGSCGAFVHWCDSGRPRWAASAHLAAYSDGLRLMSPSTGRRRQALSQSRDDVIDRVTLRTVRGEDMREVRLVLRPSGVFLFTAYHRNCPEGTVGFRLPAFSRPINPA